MSTRGIGRLGGIMLRVVVPWYVFEGRASFGGMALLAAELAYTKVRTWRWWRIRGVSFWGGRVFREGLLVWMLAWWVRGTILLVVFGWRERRLLCRIDRDRHVGEI